MPNANDRLTNMLLGAVKADALTPRAKQLMAEAQDFTLADFGISSVEAQALLKRIEAEFGVEIPPEEAENFRTVQDLTDYINARS